MTNDAEILSRFRDVSVSYHGDIMVLRDLNLDFRRGLVTGIIGPNGAGKSTVLKTLIGSLRPRKGDIEFDGRSTVGVPVHRLAAREIGYVPQSRSLFLDLTVDDNLQLGCWTFRKDRERMKRALAEAYDTFPGLAAHARQAAGSLSGGQRRFLEIARALLPRPRMLLLDEPTAMVAPKFAAEIYARIRALADAGTTVVLVDQNIKPCVAIADWIYVLELGRNSAEGSAQDLRSEGRLRAMVAGWLEVSGG